MSREDDPKAIPHGGPLFISVQEGNTIVFNYDDFTRSFALRDVKMDLGEEGFLKRLYEQDNYVPYFLKAKELLDLSPHCNCLMREIENIYVYRYPGNYLGKPIGYDAINEMAIGLMLFDGEELLVISGMGREYRALGVTVVGWDDVHRES